jgi:hypothetical protein
MNWEDHSRVLCLAYQMLSTGLFTAAPFYSQLENPKKLNAGAPLARFPEPSAPRHAAPPPPPVDKFSPASAEKNGRAGID